MVLFSFDVIHDVVAKLGGNDCYSITADGEMVMDFSIFCPHFIHISQTGIAYPFLQHGDEIPFHASVAKGF